MKNFAEYITRYPKITIAMCLIITALFATQLPKLWIDASVKGNFPPEFPAKLAIDELEEIFGGSEIVLLGIESQNIYDQKTLELIQRLTEEIEELEEVDDVVSLFTVNDIVGTEEGMEVNELIEEFPETEEDIQALRERIRANELFWNNIISEDETATAIIATITTEAKDDVVYERFQTIVDRETKAQDERHLEGDAHLSPVKFYLGGMPITRALIIVSIQRDMKRFFPAGLLLMILLLYFCFGSLRGILLPFTVVVMSLICTFGLMGFLGKPITMIGIIIPPMLIAIANDYSIHLVARYYEDVKTHIEQLSTQAITVKVMTRLGVPVLLAGVTTVAGFSSLLTHIMPPAKDLGIFASFGIILAFIFSMTFVPAWLSLLPIPKVLAEGKRKERLEFLLRKITLFITKYPATPKILVVVGICIAVVSATGIHKIVVDTNPMNYYTEDYPLVVSTNLLNEKLGGAMTIDVVFEGNIKDPQVLKKMEELQEYMDTLPHIGKTMSMVDYLKEMNQVMHEDDPAYHTIPETQELVAQYLLLYSMSGDPEDFDRVVDYEYRKGHLIGRVNVTGTTEIAETARHVEEYIQEHFADVATPKVGSITGFSVLFKELIPLVVRGQMRSLLLSLGIIFMLGALAFRSVVAGIFTIYPISVAMLLVFGLMGYQGIELNITTAMLSSILIGVGVDYTIHFLYHYREEVQHAGLNPHKALEVTLTTSGKGIIYNALSVVVGFCILMLSQFLPVFFFGWLLTFSILACLVGALTLLPAAVLVFKPKFIFGTSQSATIPQKSEKPVVDQLRR
jgi:hydrophobe/amphiphile efflux-3 (HAE3) family protein